MEKKIVCIKELPDGEQHTSRRKPQGDDDAGHPAGRRDGGVLLPCG